MGAVEAERTYFPVVFLFTALGLGVFCVGDDQLAIRTWGCGLIRTAGTLNYLLSQCHWRSIRILSAQPVLFSFLLGHSLDGGNEGSDTLYKLLTSSFAGVPLWRFLR